MDNAIIINGQSFEFTPGETILQVAQRVGIHIPTLCYLKDAFPTGACRICVVEIYGNRGLVSACSTPATPNLKICTESPAVVKARKTVIELLMISGNHNCAARGNYANEWTDYQQEVQDYDQAYEICVAYGKCQLQALAYKYMVTERTIERIPTQYPLEYDDPLIGRDFSRCILCGRCVQACSEVQVNNAISHGYRGNIAKIVVRGDRTLPDSECVYCGECVQACPVGALFEKRNRYDARLWEIQTTQTTCHYCGVGCQLELYLKDKTILKIHGAKDTAPNYGRLCFKGRFAFDFLNSPQRLTKPMVREKGELKTVSWEQAFNVIHSHLKDIMDSHGPQSVAAILSPRYTNEDLFAVKSFFHQSVGPDRLIHFEPPAYHAPDYQKLKDADVLVVIEEDIDKQHPVASSFIKQTVRRTAPLILVQPEGAQMTVLAKKADVRLTNTSDILKAIEPYKKVILIHQAKFDVSAFTNNDKIQIFSIQRDNNTMGLYKLGIPMAKSFDTASLQFIYSMGYPVKKNHDSQFLVAQDIFPADWHKDVDVLLPVAVWVEYEGSYTTAGGAIKKVSKVVDAPEETKPTQWIFNQLAELFGFNIQIPESDQMGDISPPGAEPLTINIPDTITRPDFQHQLYSRCQGVMEAMEKNLHGGK